jgi:resolvase domain protein
MNRDKKRYWLYGRVASPDKWALENQMNYLRSFAEKHKLNIVGESWDAASGLTFDRPGLNDFLEAVRQGQADALLTKDLTRLGRDTMQTATWIAQLNASGVGVFSVTDLIFRGL